MDIVIPLKKAARYEELRYCLRSIEENLPHDRIILIGARPDWAQNITYIGNEPEEPSRYARVANNILMSTWLPDLSNDFVLFNDDFFVLHPTTEIPVLHKGLLREQLDKVNLKTPLDYAESIARTYALLKRNLDIDPINYEVHMPMVINRKKLEKLQQDMHKTLPPNSLHYYQWRSLYGNYYKIGGKQTEDYKIYHRDSIVPGNWAVSTSGVAFSHGDAGNYLRSRFSKPSRYEI